MSESGGFNGGDNIDVQGGSFSRLLLSTHAHQTSPFFSTNTPNMLCFGDFTSQMSSSFTSHSCTEIPSASSFGNAAITTLNNNNKRRSGSGQETGLGSENGQKNGRKRNKPEMGPTSTTTNATLVGHVKRKKEKLGERISALQQLVCPYGKDQVKVLSTPYLQQPLPSPSSPQHSLSASDKTEPITEKAYDTPKRLRSRGLCLIPVEYIFGVANTNGADFWSYSTSSSGP